MWEAEFCSLINFSWWFNILRSLTNKKTVGLLKGMHDPAARLKKQNKRTPQELFIAQGFAAAKGGDGLLRSACLSLSERQGARWRGDSEMQWTPA